MYTAYVLDDDSRQELLTRFPPKYPSVIGHHITERFGVPESTSVPKKAILKVIGYIDSGDGLEALVVSVNGNKKRPDGGLYHITWSLDILEYKPKDSNELLRKTQFTMILPEEISATPSILD